MSRRAWAPALAVALAPALLAACASDRAPQAETLVVVVPSRHDGHIGTVVVNEGGKQEVLHEAYASARTTSKSAEIQRSTLTPDAVSKVFNEASAALPHKAMTYTLYFVVAKPELTGESRATLDSMLSEVASRQAAEIVVTGHTDRMGTDERNEALSLERAQWVRDLLIKRGTPGDIVSAVGMGEREPVVPTADGIAEPQNRRVEILVR